MTVVYLPWYLIGARVAFVATSIVLLGGCALTALTIYRRILAAIAHNRERLGSLVVQETGNCYRQIEALINIRSELGIQKALPPMRGWAVSPDFAEVMVGELKARSPTRVLECGSGASTLVIAYFLRGQGSGHVVSLEHDREYAKKSSQLVAQHGLQMQATVIYAPLIPYSREGREFLWYDVSAVGESACFDFVAVDGPPKDIGPLARWPLLCVLGDRLAPESAIVMDDTNRPDERCILEQWKESVPHVVISDYETEKGAAVLFIPETPLK